MSKKIAYVTGGMGGLGTAFCQSLAQQGFKVVAGHSLQRDPSDWLKQQHKAGFEFIASACDVTDWDSCVAAFDKVKKEHGVVSVLVNNAGITRDAKFRKMKVQAWHDVINTNLNSLFNVTKQVVEDMVGQKWGRIINIGSINGQRGQFGQTNYSAAKAGIHGFTMALAQELANKHITVNTISPGYVGTEMVRAVPADILDKLVATIPLKRLGEPKEIASLVAWLASEEAAFATGANFDINGGMYMN
ncbi:acetoacetyl-CoA reductase [Brackiella oedipodis]|uniref:acetoacetyl-CoA reductase n=1 Tax=Brackiella oedipodis TaxID=124225 RepID=UPI00048E308D|nr:acetoacetyl-CoA reductase [Brackiella oedipodis]